ARTGSRHARGCRTRTTSSRRSAPHARSWPGRRSPAPHARHACRCHTSERPGSWCSRCLLSCRHEKSPAPSCERAGREPGVSRSARAFRRARSRPPLHRRAAHARTHTHMHADGRDGALHTLVLEFVDENKTGPDGSYRRAIATLAPCLTWRQAAANHHGLRACGPIITHAATKCQAAGHLHRAARGAVSLTPVLPRTLGPRVHGQQCNDLTTLVALELDGDPAAKVDEGVGRRRHQLERLPI